MVIGMVLPCCKMDPGAVGWARELRAEARGWHQIVELWGRE